MQLNALPINAKENEIFNTHRQRDQECGQTEEFVNYITNLKTDKNEKWQ
jgi:hypothetical protein